ncbi:MAG: putative Histidine kinase [Candidatus Saccharibacteria bacterium]|nr:putative Histidine kinase [Candidatus Saccharibacteria bacterium]
MNAMFRSATFKLTIYYLMIVMIISLVFSSALFHVTTGEVRRGLRLESARITSEYPVFQNSPGLMSPDADADRAAARIFWRLVSINVVVFIGAGILSYLLAKRTLMPIEEAHMQQSRFTSDVSHELRTPLTAVRMESEVALLDSKADSSELRSTIKSTLEEVGKMELLINNLLRLTKLDAAQLEASFRPLDTSELVNGAISRVSKTAQQHTISLTDSVTHGAVVRGDQPSLEQLFVILLDNAIKYSPKASKVTVSSKLTTHHIEVVIKDEGIGIERPALDHIFERFYRADSSRTKSDAEGFGLGLSIAKNIADAHNATILITSQAGKGTTATVRLALDK